MRDNTALTCSPPDCHQAAGVASSRSTPLCDRHAVDTYRAVAEHMKSMSAVMASKLHAWDWHPIQPSVPCPTSTCSGHLLRGTQDDAFVPRHEYKCSNFGFTCSVWVDEQQWSKINEQSMTATPNVVYYLKFRDRIKIGTTSDIAKRLMAIPNDGLLATEPGGIDIERKRHRQFAKFRDHGEWFTQGAPLIEHIKSLQT